MRTGLGLCVLGLLCLHSSVFGQEVQPGVLIFCDDPSVDRAVKSSIDKFNKEISTGHMLALYQVTSASKAENGSDSVYSLKFTTRRSDCKAGENKPWTDCDYLPTGHKEPISCNSTVLMTETEADTTQVDCALEKDIVPERAYCMGCPEDIPIDSEDLKVPMLASLSKYNTESEHSHLFTLNTVGHATRQVVAGLRFKLTFDMRRSICAKADNKELHELCVADDDNMEFSNCNTTVDVAPWRHVEPQVSQILCEMGALSSFFTRRRPPGFSPLRNFLFDKNPDKAPSPKPSPTPSLSPTKTAEESSEEDTTGSQSPTTTTADPVNDSPFHCPSKAWKVFNPAPPAAPTKATAEVNASPQPTGTLSDQDLLG